MAHVSKELLTQRDDRDSVARILAVWAAIQVILFLKTLGDGPHLHWSRLKWRWGPSPSVLRNNITCIAAHTARMRATLSRSSRCVSSSLETCAMVCW